MEETIPAESSAIENAPVVETPVATAPTGPVSEPASKTTEPSASPAPKPDLAALLADAELKRELLKHPDIAGEIEHRVRSAEGRLKADMERQRREDDTRREQERQAELARQERARLKSMDEYELGVETKQQLEQQDAEDEIQKRLLPYQERLKAEQEKYQTEFLRSTGLEVFGSVQEVAKEAGASEADMEKLSPANYPSLGAYVKGAIAFLSTQRGQKLAKEMAKVEAAAIVEDKLASGRESAPSATVLPAGESGQGDSAFLEAYAGGRSNDHARAMRLLSS